MTSSTSTNKTTGVAVIGYTDVDEVTVARILRRDRERRNQPVKRVPPTQQAGFSLLK